MEKETKKDEKVSTPPPKKKKKNGCCGCLVGTLITVVVLIIAVLGVGYFLADNYLMENFGIGMVDCIALIDDVYSVDENKVITEGNPTAQDKDDLYEQISTGTFIKKDKIEDVTGTAVSQTVIPMVDQMVNGTQESPANLTTPQTEDGKFDWEEYLEGLVESGAVDVDKLNAFFNSSLTVGEVYEDKFVFEIKGKGVIALADSILNKTLDGVDGLQSFKGTAGIRQLAFKDEGGVKSVNVVLSLKAKQFANAFLDSKFFTTLAGEELAGYKDEIKGLASLLPKQVMASVTLVIDDSASMKVTVNNMSDAEISKWFGFIKQIAGVDLQEKLDAVANDLYTQVVDFASDYLNVVDSIKNGHFRFDLYDLVSKVLNKNMELEGADALSKEESVTTVANALYANMDVNGNGREEIIENYAPTFAGSDWQDDTRADFASWLKTNVAFNSNEYTLDDLMANFTDETGKLVAPENYATLLEYLDVNYIRSGLAFLKSDLIIDDRFIAYLFEEYKQEIFTTVGLGEYADCVKLEYVSLSQKNKSDGMHTYLSVGVSATTKELLETLGFGEFAFIKSVIGEELFVCAKADVSFDTSLEREQTTFSLNGLSETQTMEIISTVNKIAKENLIDKFVDAYIIDVIDKINVFRNDYFNVVINVDAQGNGLILLPSATNMLEIILNKTQEKDIDAHAFVDALSEMLTSTYEPVKYTSYLSATNEALTSNANAYESYDEVVINELFADYFIKTEGKTASELIDLLIEVMKNPNDALDIMMGEEGSENLLINKAYFENRTTLESTKPIIDGHTLAFVLDKAKPNLASLIEGVDEQMLSYIEICDVIFTKADEKLYMDVVVNVKIASLIDEYVNDLGDYKEFVKKLLGGQDATMALALRVCMENGEDTVKINLAGLSDTHMNAIFDVLTEFGLKIFDFSDPNNDLVSMVGKVKGFILDFVELSENGTTIKMPSLFQMANEQVINNAEVTNEEFFFAIRDFVTSNVDTANYLEYDKVQSSVDALASDSIIDGFTVDQQKTVEENWESVVEKAIEDKYLLKNEKNVSHIIETIMLTGKDRVDALLGSEDGTVDGIMDTSFQNLKTYFTTQYKGAVMSDSRPHLDGNALAYILDNNKDKLDGVVDLDEKMSALLEKVSVDAVSVEEGKIIVKVRFNVSDMLETMQVGADIDLLFSLIDDECENISLSIKKSLDSESAEKCTIVVNDMTAQQLENLSDILKVFGVDYFDTQSENNIFETLSVSIRDMVNEFMPYDETSELFMMASIFAYAGEEISDRFGENLDEFSMYALLKSFVLYEGIQTQDATASAKVEFDNKTRANYYIDNGTESIKNMFLATENIENELTFVSSADKTTREFIIEDNKALGVSEKTYKQRFVISEQNLAGLIENLGIGALGEGYTLANVNVAENDVITLTVVVEMGALFEGSSKMSELDRFNVLPDSIAISLPLSFNSTLVSGYNIAGINETITGITEFELRGIINRLVNVESAIDDVRANVTSDMGTVLDENGLKFVYSENAGVKDENATGLEFPSLTELFVSVLNRDEHQAYTQESMNTLFDDFICLTTFESEVDVKAGKAHFTDHMVENYYMKEDLLPHSTDAEIDNTFRKLLVALDLVELKEGESDVEMFSLLDPDKFDVDSIANSKRVLFGEDELTAIFSDIADYGMLEVLEAHVPFDGAVSIIGNVNLSAFMPDSMSPMMQSFAPEKLSIMIVVVHDGTKSDYLMTTDEGKDIYYHYEICNLNTYEEGDQAPDKRSKTNNIINLFDEFGADIHEDDFASFAQIINQSINIVFEKIVGRNAENTQDVSCELVHDYDNSASIVAETDITTGVILPSVVEYARKRNWIGSLLGA